MAASAPQLLGAVIRLVKREATGWTVAGIAITSGEGAAGGSALSASASGVLKAKDEVETELSKLLCDAPDANRAQANVQAALDAGTLALFKSLCDPVTFAAVSASVLAQSATVASLNTIQVISRSALAFGSSGSQKGGYLAANIISTTLPFFKRAKADRDEARTDKMASLIESFVAEVVEKAWGLKDVWEDVSTDESNRCSPLEKAAEAGSLPLVRTVLHSARTADVAKAAYAAYVEGHEAVFDLLIETQRCLNSDGWLLVEALFQAQALADPKEPELRVRCEKMLETFLRRWPQAIESVWRWEGDSTCRRALEAAVCLGSAKLVSTVLGLGSRTRYDISEQVIGGKPYAFYPTLYYALSRPSLPVMKLLVDVGAFENLGARYSEKALWSLAAGFNSLLIACYPWKTGPASQEKTYYRADGLEVLDLVLSTGFSYPWVVDSEGQVCNIVLDTLAQAVMEEEHVVDLLSRCKAAGVDILHSKKEDVGKPHGVGLAVKAARVGFNRVLDLAIEMQGPESVDAYYEERTSAGTHSKTTPLLAAISDRKLATVQHLLRAHKAKAAYRSPFSDEPHMDQPIVQALFLEDDNIALPFVRELINADPSFCNLDCFVDHTGVTPVMLCCHFVLPNTLEAILSADLPGVKAMCKQRFRKPNGTGDLVDSSPAYMLADEAQWGMLSTMLRYCPAVPVIAPTKVFRADGTWLRDLPTVVERAEQNRAPRLLLLKLKAMAKQQLADAAKGKASAAKSSVPSNAFEDPTNRVVTEAEERKKAKKREQKRKAKAKKRATAAASTAHAGAGREDAGSSSDSDSSGPDEEEEGMDEEERMLARAPTFDLEKERATRKARAEQEKEKEGKE
jgi:hypothetical protein